MDGENKLAIIDEVKKQVEETVPKSEIYRNKSVEIFKEQLNTEDVRERILTIVKEFLDTSVFIDRVKEISDNLFSNRGKELKLKWYSSIISGAVGAIITIVVGVSIHFLSK